MPSSVPVVIAVSLVTAAVALGWLASATLVKKTRSWPLFL
jgi:hypothetical protein